MTFSKTLLASTLVVFNTTCLAHEIVVANNSSTAVTAKTHSSPCSSVAGSKGILKPHQKMTVYQLVEDLYCSGGCDSEVYASQSCSDRSIATVHLDNKNGITSVKMHNDAYQMTSTKYYIALEGGKGMIEQWLEKLFG